MGAGSRLWPAAGCSDGFPPGCCGSVMRSSHQLPAQTPRIGRTGSPWPSWLPVSTLLTRAQSPATRLRRAGWGGRYHGRAKIAEMSLDSLSTRSPGRCKPPNRPQSSKAAAPRDAPGATVAQVRRHRAGASGPSPSPRGLRSCASCFHFIL